MAVDLGAVCKALATQIGDYLKAKSGRDTNIDPFPNASYQPPSLTVYPPVDPILYRQNLWPDSDTITLRLKLQVDSDEESMMIKIYDYLGIGSSANSSIREAVKFDPTLGGAVVDAAVISATISDPDTEPGVAWFDVEIILQNAS